MLHARIETRRMEDAAGPWWSDARAPWRKRLTTAQLPCSPPPLPSMLPWHVLDGLQWRAQQAWRLQKNKTPWIAWCLPKVARVAAPHLPSAPRVVSVDILRAPCSSRIIGNDGLQWRAQQAWRLQTKTQNEAHGGGPQDPADVEVADSPKHGNAASCI